MGSEAHQSCGRTDEQACGDRQGPTVSPLCLDPAHTTSCGCLSAKGEATNPHW